MHDCEDNEHPATTSRLVQSPAIPEQWERRPYCQFRVSVTTYSSWPPQHPSAHLVTTRDVRRGACSNVQVVVKPRAHGRRCIEPSCQTTNPAKPIRCRQEQDPDPLYDRHHCHSRSSPRRRNITANPRCRRQRRESKGWSLDLQPYSRAGRPASKATNTVNTAPTRTSTPAARSAKSTSTQTTGIGGPGGFPYAHMVESN